MSKYFRVLFATTVVLLFAFNVAAVAVVKKDVPKQEKAKNTASYFNEMDKNRDGKITKDEFINHNRGYFEKMKKAGKDVTVESFESYFVAIFDERDKNKDGVIKKNEIITSPKMDKNKDGKVALKEWKAFFKARVKVMDKNKDGKISQEEYDAFFEIQFKNLDKNGDYLLTEVEWMEKVPAKKKEKKK